ncbi:hypothetical protein [Streptomyces sp. TLI_146]|uniref:hypothetical protein n=1 Tax=Streptomyces sp. TLI_146 TaxID=1938858 RepID=UPI000CB14298|nr:hypothetical protein [Streptomyces sp. TLI_146]PKV82724.1 hypothetical protein BX283_0171 [Streptomyces sp. TLI_146]
MAVARKLFRGQKQWTPGMPILAMTMRESRDPEKCTEHELEEIAWALRQVEIDRRSKTAKDRLFNLLLSYQDTRTLSPYVSFASTKSVALNFALEDDTPGYVIEINDCGLGDTLDFNSVRRKYDLWADQKPWLNEIGVPRAVTPELIRRVSLVKYDDLHRVTEEVIYGGSTTGRPV